MSEMDRRTFLLSTGRWLALAALAPALSGCGRLLGWSDSQGGIGEDTAIASGGDQAPATTTTSSGTSEAATTTTTAPTLPDLAVIRGESPDLNVRAAVTQLGGMERFVKPNAKVVVKPNVLTGRAPEYAVCTNPIVIGAIVRMCYEAGAAQVTVLDNPTSSPRGAFQEAGLTQATQEAGGTVKFLSNRNFETVQIPEGEVLTSWPLVTDVFEADTFINVPICKVHGGAGLTLAMKNLMGIMGGSRGKIHTQFPKKITDLCTLVKPQLVILDAYRTLVRNGPGGGNLSDVRMPKTCVAGTSQVGIDAYGCSIMGWKPAALSSLAEAGRRGLGDIDLSQYTIYEGTA
jgi:uncharacterized protein (DUF362 family)